MALVAEDPDGKIVRAIVVLYTDEVPIIVCKPVDIRMELLVVIAGGQSCNASEADVKLSVLEGLSVDKRVLSTMIAVNESVVASLDEGGFPVASERVRELSIPGLLGDKLYGLRVARLPMLDSDDEAVRTDVVSGE